MPVTLLRFAYFADIRLSILFHFSALIIFLSFSAADYAISFISLLFLHLFRYFFFFMILMPMLMPCFMLIRHDADAIDMR